MPEKRVDMTLDIKGRVTRSNWQEISPIVHSLLGKVGELGLADSLEVNFSVSHEQKRKPSIRSAEEFNLPDDVQFRVLSVDDEELKASSAQAGQTVRTRRTELGLTQEKVTELMGDQGGHGWLSNLERNTMTGKRPLAPKVYLLAEALSLDHSELLSQYGYEMIIEAEQSS